MSGETAGHAAAVDPTSIAYRVHAHAFNTLTTMLAADDRFVPLSVREAVTGAIVEVIEPLIRADEHERQRLEVLQARGEQEETAAELDRIKTLHADWLGRFFRGSAGWDARVSGLILARAYRDAGLPLPDSLSHLAGQL